MMYIDIYVCIVDAPANVIFIHLKEAMDVFQSNHWEVKNTMIELGKLDKQKKLQQRQQREDSEKVRKKEAAEKREEQRKLKLVEREQEIFARNSVKEKLKAQKESLKGKNNLLLHCCLFIICILFMNASSFV